MAFLRKGIITACLLTIFHVCLFSQTCSIKGKVNDQSKQPLIGATVALLGKQIQPVTGKYTAKDGTYRLQGITPGTYTVRASYIGYKNSENKITIRAGEEIKLDFELAQDVIGLDEVVVTGIASNTEKAVADIAVTRINAAELQENNKYQDFSQMVTGKIPGVLIEPSSGNVGGGVRFTMRGSGGLNGDGQPIIYVDGIRLYNAELNDLNGEFLTGGQNPGTLSDLNTDEIASVEILKGPVGSSVYGTNGSNGVILIKTNRGGWNEDYFKANMHSVIGWNEQAKEYTGTNSDRLNSLFRNGPIQEYGINFMGKSGIFNYYANYTDRSEKGIIAQNGYNRKSVRLNLDVNPTTEWMFKASGNFITSINNEPQNDDNTWAILGARMLTDPDSVEKARRFAMENVLTQYDIDRNLFSVEANYMPEYLKGLNLRAVFGMDNYDYSGISQTKWGLYYDGFTKGIKYNRGENIKLWNSDISISYSYDLLDNLHLTSIIGTQLFSRKRAGQYNEELNFPNENIYNFASSVDRWGYDDWYWEERQAGLFYQQEVKYSDAYFLNFSLRKDYSSLVGNDAPSILYPKISGAIRLDKLFSGLPLLNFAKIRGGYGQSGQLPGVMAAEPVTWSGSSSGFGVGANIYSLGSPSIEPERINEVEVGLELEFLNSYGVDFTYYNQNAKKSILYAMNAPSTGKTSASMPINIGEVQSWGFETMVYANPLKTKDYKLDFSLILNYSDNKIISMGGAQPIIGNYTYGRTMWVEGYPKSSFVDYKVLAGFDADGKYTGPVLDPKLTNLGNAIPNWTGSFKTSLTFLKNFQLSFLFDWALGLYVKNITRSKGINYDQMVENLNKNFTPKTDAYNKEAQRIAEQNPNFLQNFVEPADWLRLREISLKVDVNDWMSDLLKNGYFKNLYLGVSVHNVWMSTKYSGPDPTVTQVGSRHQTTRGVDFMTLQNPRTYNFFINFGF